MGGNFLYFNDLITVEQAQAEAGLYLTTQDPREAFHIKERLRRRVLITIALGTNPTAAQQLAALAVLE